MHIINLSRFAMYDDWMVSYIYREYKHTVYSKTHGNEELDIQKTVLSVDSLPTNTLRAAKTVSSGIGVGGSCKS